jgi:tetratricopeptide (TPR) repeat protein
MNAPDSVFAKAVQLHKSGDIAAAIKLYEKVVRSEPKHAVALNLLGLACSQAGKLERAADAIGKALALKPDLPDAHYNLAAVLQALGRHEEAVSHYSRALATRGADADAQNNLGTTLKALGRLDEAIAHFRKAVALRPGWGAAHFNLGNALQENKQNQEAIGHYDQAIRLMPNPVEAHINLGNALLALNRNAEAAVQFRVALARVPDAPSVHYNLGNALRGLEKLEEAIEHYKRAISGNPGHAEAYLNGGVLLFALGRYEEAEDQLKRAIALKPVLSEAHLGMGNLFSLLDRYDEAVGHYRMAATAEPNSAKAHFNIGSALESLGRYEEAMQSYERALSIDPQLEFALWATLNLPLSHGDFSTGWPNFERYRTAGHIKSGPNPSYPRWDGVRFQGTLLVWGDQALGEQIIFASMVPELREYADRVIVQVEPRLVSLFARSFPYAEVIPFGAAYPEPIDFQEPLSSLGRFLRPTWESFPKHEHGYLVADEKRSARLRRHLKADGRTVVGLSWRSKNVRFGVSKTIPLRDFEPLLRAPGLRFVDLQYGDTREERDSIKREFGVEVLGLEEIDNTNDVDGLAALMGACDVVVSVSNTNAHLAGALGRPTIVLLRYGFGRFWHWFRNRDDSPWYPRVRILSQGPTQPWGELVRSALSEINKLGG